MSPLHLERVKGWTFSITTRRWLAKVFPSWQLCRMTSSMRRTWPWGGQAQSKQPLVLHFQAFWQALAKPLQRASLITKPFAHLSGVFLSISVWSKFKTAERPGKMQFLKEKNYQWFIFFSVWTLLQLWLEIQGKSFMKLFLGYGIFFLALSLGFAKRFSFLGLPWSLKESLSNSCPA